MLKCLGGNLLALITLAACITYRTTAMAAEYLSEQAAKLAVTATVKVLATNETGPIRRRVATGFVWRNNNRVVTALHTVVGADKILVEYGSAPGDANGGIETSLARIVAEDWNTDLAVLEVFKPPRVASAFSMSASPKVGEGLWVIGFPFETQGLRSARLYVSEIAPKNLRGGLTPEAARELQGIGLPSLELEVLHVEGALLPGNSGSPIINGDGAIVAVGDGGLLKGTIGLGWGIPSIHLNGLIERERRPPTADLGQIARVTTAFSSASLQTAPAIEEQSRTVRLQLTEAPRMARPLAIASSGQRAVFGLGDSIFLIDTNSNRTTVTLEAAPGIGTNAAISPDGKLLAAGTSDGKVLVWDTITGKITKTLETEATGSYTAINTVLFSNNSKLIAAGSRSSAYLWEYQTGKLTPDVIQRPVNEVQQLAFSSDDELLASGQWAGSVSVYNISERRIIANIGDIGTVTGLSFSPDRSQLAVSISYSALRLYRPNTAVHVSTLPTDGIEVGPIAFLDMGRTLAGIPSLNRRDVCIWTLASKARRCEPGSEKVGGAAFVQLLSDSKTIGWGTRTALVFADGQTGQVKRIVEPEANSLSSVRLARRAPSAAWRNTSSNSITVFDFFKGNIVRVLNSEGRYPENDRLAAYSADAGLLAVEKFGQTRIVVSSTGQELLSIPANGMTTSVDFSTDGKFVAVGTGGRTLDIWRVQEKDLHRSFKFEEVPSGVGFSEDGTLIAVNASKLTEIWDVASGQRKRTFPLNAYRGGPVLFSPRGDLLAVSESWEKRIRLWSLTENGRFDTLRHFYNADAMSFSRDGTILAAGDGSAVRLWDTQKGALLKQYRPNVGTVRSISFTSNDHLLVIGGTLGLAVLNASTGKVELELRAISANHWIAMGSNGRVAGIFDKAIPYDVISPSAQPIQVDKAYLSSLNVSPSELFQIMQTR